MAAAPPDPFRLPLAWHLPRHLLNTLEVAIALSSSKFSNRARTSATFYK
jgi:hypothetical protein